MKRIIVAGGSGFIGKKVCQYLQQMGYDISILTRKKRSELSFPQFLWSPENQTLESEALDGVDYILNLAGENIAEQKWSVSRKAEISKSRTDSNQLFFNFLKNENHTVKGYFSAAAIGYYGDRGEEHLNEDSLPSGTGFLSTSCIEWEKSIHSIATLDIPTTWFRLGLVLSMEGGALPQLASPLRFGINPYLGNGNQYYSWIHIQDVCRGIEHCIENKLTGAINLTAPLPVRNIVLSKLLEHAIGKHGFPFPIPRILLKAILGEKSTLVLDSSYVEPQRLSESGFEFSFPNLSLALQDIFKK